MALSAIVALSAGQLWVALLACPSRGWLGRTTNLLAAATSTFVLTVGAFALYRGAAIFLHPVLGELPPPSGFLSWFAAMIPVVTLVALSLVHAILPLIGHAPLGRAFHVHALHGFYFGALADRLVDFVWTRPSFIKVRAYHA